MKQGAFKTYLATVSAKYLEDHTEGEAVEDFLNTNFVIINDCIHHADRMMGWGHNSHAGNSKTHRLKFLYEYLTDKKNRDNRKYERLFYEACKTRQFLGDLMFRANHGLK